MVRKLATRPRPVAAALLVLATAGWGATFVVMKGALAHASVPEFLWWRFVLAGAVLVVVRPAAVVRLGWRGLGQGVVLGAVLSAAYLLQTAGLRTTPAAVAGFLTGLQVVLTPLIGWALLRHAPGRRTWTATAAATLGLAIFSLHGIAFGAGELLTLASAAMFALQIVMLGRWVSAGDAYGLATVQLVVVGAVSFVAAAPGGVALPSSGAMWGAVALTALVASAFAFVAQSWAQSHLSASAAAVVFTAEPVFAALFAWAGGEHLGWSLFAGGALVVAAMLLLARTPVPGEAIAGADAGAAAAPGPPGAPAAHGDPVTGAPGAQELPVAVTVTQELPLAV